MYLYVVENKLVGNYFTASLNASFVKEAVCLHTYMYTVLYPCVPVHLRVLGIC